MAIKLPNLQSPDRIFNQYQTGLSTALAPVLSNPASSALLVSNIPLKASGVNTVNHGLKQKLTGWQLARVRGNSVIWDSQDGNAQSEVSLLLNCSADVSVDILVW